MYMSINYYYLKKILLRKGFYLTFDQIIYLIAYDYERKKNWNYMVNIKPI